MLGKGNKFEKKGNFIHDAHPQFLVEQRLRWFGFPDAQDVTFPFGYAWNNSANPIQSGTAEVLSQFLLLVRCKHSALRPANSQY